MKMSRVTKRPGRRANDVSMALSLISPSVKRFPGQVTVTRQVDEARDSLERSRSKDSPTTAGDGDAQ